VYDPNGVGSVRNAFLVASAVAWIALIAAPGDSSAVHSAMHPSAGVSFTTAMRAVLSVDRLTVAGINWMLMLTAMMAPALIPPAAYVRQRSFTHQRRRLIALFVAGYAVSWISAGVLIACASLALTLLYPPWLALTVAAAIAVLWQCAPIKQHCLNRCHALPTLSAFDGAAYVDVARFGITHGVWCVGSCWALMLVPVVAPSYHVASMAAVAVLVIGERIEPPARARWHLRRFDMVTRLAVVRGRWLAQRVGGRWSA
jgi:predicted metal-binding membrane protein